MREPFSESVLRVESKILWTRVSLLKDLRPDSLITVSTVNDSFSFSISFGNSHSIRKKEKYLTN